jgi:hypothetical protein
MWISRSKYNSLLERLTKLEARESADEITFGHYSAWCSAKYNEDKFLPAEYRREYLSGERVSARELICLIANHLGFKYEPEQSGKLVTPKAKEKSSK